MNVFVDFSDQKLVSGLNASPASSIKSYSMILRDYNAITLYVVAPTVPTSANQPFTPMTIDDGASISFAMKDPANLQNDPLVKCAAWTPGTDALGNPIYSGQWILNTAELIAFMGSKSSATLRAEFTLVQGGNDQFSTQFDVVITPDVIRDSDGVPATLFNTLEQFTDESGVPGVRLINGAGVIVGMFKNGCPYVFCLDDGSWNPIIVTTVDGKKIISLGAGEMA